MRFIAEWIMTSVCVLVFGFVAIAINDKVQAEKNSGQFYLLYNHTECQYNNMWITSGSGATQSSIYQMPQCWGPTAIHAIQFDSAQKAIDWLNDRNCEEHAWMPSSGFFGDDQQVSCLGKDAIVGLFEKKELPIQFKKVGTFETSKTISVPITEDKHAWSLEKP